MGGRLSASIICKEAVRLLANEMTLNQAAAKYLNEFGRPGSFIQSHADFEIPDGALDGSLDDFSETHLRPAMSRLAGAFPRYVASDDNVVFGDIETEALPLPPHDFAARETCRGISLRCVAAVDITDDRVPLICRFDVLWRPAA